jgi:D-alanyl-D-alanine carboxypeptidase
VDGKSGEVLGGSKAHVRRGMASLTKIMTCYMVLQLVKLNAAIKEEMITVSHRAAATNGTRHRSVLLSNFLTSKIFCNCLTCLLGTG